MLFQAVVIFLPILNFFKISYKRGKAHWKLMLNLNFEFFNNLENNPPIMYCLQNCFYLQDLICFKDFVTTDPSLL